MRTGTGPILHFDMHGSKEKGLEIAATGERVPWPDLVKKLQAINRATGNNLCVISASCFGLHAIMQIKIIETVPFYVLIAPENEVIIGFLEDHTVSFYNDVFSSCDIVAAHKKHLAGAMKLFHCEKMLAVAIGKYISNACKGKSGRERRERLLTEILIDGDKRSSQNLKEVRKKIKEGLRLTQKLVDRFGSVFSCG